MPTTKKSAKKQAKVRVYTLEVGLRNGPAGDQNPVASRTLQLRGDQTLEELHRAIFAAFERSEDYSYEFQFNAGPLHPEGKRYVLPGAYDVSVEAKNPAAGRVTDTVLDALQLQSGQHFGYWPDAGDDWWHPITVQRVAEALPRGTFPKVTKRIGASPFRKKGNEEPGPHLIDKSEGADAACLVGDMHLSHAEYHKAIEAFSRAIENSPTVDAYEGRAKAYRALAAQDEQAAQRLREE